MDVFRLALKFTVDFQFHDEVANVSLLFEDLRDIPLATLPDKFIDELSRVSVIAPESVADSAVRCFSIRWRLALGA